MGAPTRSYRELIVWQRALDLVEVVYEITRQLPPQEQYGITAQLRRAVISIPTNIAEGYGRATQRDFANFLSIARGSLMETEALLLVGERLGYLRSEMSTGAHDRIDEVSRLLSSLRRRVTRTETPDSSLESKV